MIFTGQPIGSVRSDSRRTTGTTNSGLSCFLNIEAVGGTGISGTSASIELLVPGTHGPLPGPGTILFFNASTWMQFHLEQVAQMEGRMLDNIDSGTRFHCVDRYTACIPMDALKRLSACERLMARLQLPDFSVALSESETRDLLLALRGDSK